MPHNFDLKVPYYISQFAGARKELLSREIINDKKACKNFGAKNLKEFTYWAWRACGIVGVQMVLSTIYGKWFKKNTMNLIKEGLKLGGYDTKTDVGWYHDVLVKLGRKYKLNSFRLEHIHSSHIPVYIKNGYYVLSSIKSNAGGHILLIFGCKVSKNNKLEGFWFHDPGMFFEKSKSVYIAVKEFDRRFKEKIILFKKDNI